MPEWAVRLQVDSINRGSCLHPAFDPDLNGLTAAEEACAAAVDEAHTLDVRLDLLQRELQELRGLAVQQQDLLKRLIDILAGPQG